MYPNSKNNNDIDPLNDGPVLDINSPQEEQKNTSKGSPFASDFLGFREPVQRIVVGIITLVVVVVVVLSLRSFIKNSPASTISQTNPSSQASGANLQLTALPLINQAASEQLPVFEVAYEGGIPRLAQMHTTIPKRSRKEIEKYTVQAGDTVFGIAEKFGLKPETVLWGNYFTLLDNPSFLAPGQELNILPVDGTYHRWSAGEGLNGVSSFYGVTPEVIIDYPPNQLTAKAVGDFANPSIEPNTWLIIPGGTRQFITWSAPRITRDDPGVAKVLGPGFCGAITDGPVGIEVFVWPTNDHTLSGFDYSPETNHYGIDLNGETGDPIYATDNGVVVYSGWNDWGYGEMVVIDHGNGWQSLYAHLSGIAVDCGAWVNQGTVIGLMGSTGRSSGSHLHFELMNDAHGKVNPKSFLP